jgi:cytochrome c oxidase subunit 4
MEHSASLAADQVHDNHGGTKEIWRTFWILLGLTIVELILGYIMIGVANPGGRLGLKGAIIILMLAKAFYIVAYFMHLRGEIRNLVMTILIPLTLLVWAIIAFLYEGHSYKNNRNTYDAYTRERSHIQSSDKKADEKGTPETKRTGAETMQ